MIAKCSINSVQDIQSDLLRARIGSSINIVEPMRELEIGKRYEVFCLEIFKDGGVWIFVETNAPGLFPTPYPAEFFDIVDPSIDTGWTISMGNVGDGAVIKRISFPEWSSDDFFYERLVSLTFEDVSLIYRRNRTHGD